MRDRGNDIIRDSETLTPYILFSDGIHNCYLTTHFADYILLSRCSSQGISRRSGLAFYT